MDRFLECSCYSFFLNFKKKLLVVVVMITVILTIFAKLTGKQWTGVFMKFEATRDYLVANRESLKDVVMMFVDGGDTVFMKYSAEEVLSKYEQVREGADFVASTESNCWYGNVSSFCFFLSFFFACLLFFVSMFFRCFLCTSISLSPLTTIICFAFIDIRVAQLKRFQDFHLRFIIHSISTVEDSLGVQMRLLKF